ncbi:MAG: adaptor protein MecA [Clostridia bacterium]|nr:adaptor protein MecA [Clostridia bacterium]
MSEVRRQTDFDADDSHLSVQYFPSREGGCEMFICNLRDGESREEQNDLTVAFPKPCTELRPYKKRNGSFQRDCAYRLTRLDHLLSVCRRLLGHFCILDSSVYRDEGGDYFLFLTVLSSSPYTSPEEIDFISEYGTPENAPHLRLYIREHATVICPTDAIAKLSSLA